jgi:hypothetical protein
MPIRLLEDRRRSSEGMERPYSFNRIARRALAIATGAVAALALTAPGAHAGLLVKSAGACASETFEQPFLRWADAASYVLAPEGTLESTSAWRLAGATPVEGNEAYWVHAAGEHRSLAFSDGGSATTGATCVGIAHPTLRLFARNRGSLLSVLGVEVLFEDSLGLQHALPIGAIVAGERWNPTLPLPVLASLLPLLPGERTPVRFRFTAGFGGDWQIDDVYVDPYRK